MQYNGLLSTKCSYLTRQQGRLHASNVYPQYHSAYDRQRPQNKPAQAVASGPTSTIPPAYPPWLHIPSGARSHNLNQDTGRLVACRVRRGRVCRVRRIDDDTTGAAAGATAKQSGGLLFGGRLGAAVDGGRDVCEEHARVDAAVDVFGYGDRGIAGVDGPLAAIWRVGCCHGEEAAGFGLRAVRAEVACYVGYVGESHVLRHAVWRVVTEEGGVLIISDLW